MAVARGPAAPKESRDSKGWLGKPQPCVKKPTLLLCELNTSKIEPHFDITFGCVSNEMPHTMQLSKSQKILYGLS